MYKIKLNSVFKSSLSSNNILASRITKKVKNQGKPPNIFVLIFHMKYHHVFQAGLVETINPLPLCKDYRHTQLPKFLR